ncbi:hypothetical protein JVU11DRAFT_8580 [Chiua virens]|nr:hypothetical protein JVU11DRAFT_8580 [Chiua virens]
MFLSGEYTVDTSLRREKPTTRSLREHYVRCRTHYRKALDIITETLGPKTDFEQMLHRLDQWPRLTPYNFFRCLASTSPIKLSDDWKRCLIDPLLLNNLDEEFFKELENEIDEQVATICPDWLLMELQCNFMIRPIQVDIAKEMMSPRSQENTAMQINMGEGKSSIIIPMCAAALADGSQLVRIVVPAALMTQMIQILMDRVGGLVSRQIFHLAFDRRNWNNADHLQCWLSDCEEKGGILIMQPEHVLSLKLSCAEKMDRDSQSTGRDWAKNGGLKLLKFLDTHARDILDESDEVLQPKLQLIYTIGRQQHVDGYPDRWVITQQILWLARKHASSFDPRKIEFKAGHPGSFPQIRILQVDGGAQLISSIVEEVVDGHLLHLVIPSRLRKAIRDFISCKDIHPETAKMVEDYALDNTTWGGILLLLRGLLAKNILLFTLTERRWRVDYGLDLTRTLVAVPYRAKDVPAPTAEFGHPDITIVLTYLSYYYGGLTENQLRDSFEILLEQDDPSKEYSFWVAECATERMPPSLQNLTNINIRSTEQWKTHIVPLFSLCQRAIDFYLSKVVFPKHAKEYPWKISCSSWDIAERKDHLVTGFSGTNDAQYLLPASITQRDPENLRQIGSNAVILAYLLQPENASYSLTADEHGERWSTVDFLSVLVSESPEIQVLLDVGARILDLSNSQVAEAWLHITPQDSIAGAIYFNENNELMVLTRNGRSQPLSSSPLNQALDRCVAYLDHAHTRGTDIKFPRGFRAAVTLGPKITKDRLVQGCMRMRKLGHGHSVKLFAPPEVDHAIRLTTRKDGNAVITITDVLHWTICETWTDIQRRAHRWVQQGMQHKSQHEAWTRFCREELTEEQLAESYLQTEVKTLADLYAPSHSPNSTNPMIIARDIRDRCEDLGISPLPNARLEEEQEREVSREIEREREVERSQGASPAKHFLHPDVTDFVKNGIILPTSTAFRPIFTTLDSTSTPTTDANVWSPYVLATADFCETILEDGSSKGRMDEYLRPVQWVLSGKLCGNDVLVILSPFEVDRLMPDIRLSEHVHLHPYTPRTSKAMKPCDDLQLYPIPPVPSTWTPPWALIDQLNVFAGQLYLRDFDSYVRLSRFLGVHREDLPSDTRRLTKPNWLNMPGSLDQGIEETFEGNPLRFVMLLLAIRRRGIRFDDTHMGRLLQGWLLNRDDFPSFDSGGESFGFLDGEHCLGTRQKGQDRPVFGLTRLVDSGGTRIDGESKAMVSCDKGMFQGIEAVKCALLEEIR